MTFQSLFHKIRILPMRNLIVILLVRIGFFLPDSLYLRILFHLKMGSKLNLKNPRFFNEKIQWLKLYDRKKHYTVLVDKYAVKKYVADIIGEEHIVPTLGVWDNAIEIDFDELPMQFVLKTTNGCGGDIVVCKDKNCFDKNLAVKHLNEGLKKNIYRKYREWPYKNVPPRIIAEVFLSDGKASLTDYKVMCFNGVPKLIQVHEGRYQSHTQDFYDSDWNHLPIFQGVPLSGNIVEKPIFLKEMLDLSEKLSKGLAHVRVDWYFVRGRLFFGEMTFYDASGFYAFEPKEYEELLGSWITLPFEKH